MARSRPDPTCTLTCREHLDFYLWDGDQIVHEVRRRSPAIAGSSVYYGRVTYTHGPGIDAPVSVYREGDGSGRPYSVILHMNHKGHIDMGTRPDGSRIDADRYDWAGLKWPLYPRLLRSTRANMHWLGSLITLKTDGTGLVYMRNRYYDPLSGQFTQEDPIGLAGGLNLYGYAGGGIRLTSRIRLGCVRKSETMGRNATWKRATRILMTPRYASDSRTLIIRRPRTGCFRS